MKSENYPLSRSEKILTQESAEEILIYDLTINKAFCLNQTSALVWQACDGTKSVAEISRILSVQLKTKVGEDIVWLALQQLKKDGLLEAGDRFVTPFDNLSRREVVKRVGLASMVMLPVISGLVAPSALHAQSLGGCFAADGMGSNSAPGCDCAGTFDCCGICSATMTCTNDPRGGNVMQNDPGAATSCFPGLNCFMSGTFNSGSAPGCPCFGTFDCCGICSADGFCTGAPRPANVGQNDPGANPTFC